MAECITTWHIGIIGSKDTVLTERQVHIKNVIQYAVLYDRVVGIVVFDRNASFDALQYISKNIGWQVPDLSRSFFSQDGNQTNFQK